MMYTQTSARDMPRTTDDAQARIHMANQLLAGHRYGTQEHERGLELMRQAAEGPLGAQAQWLLGAYFLQVGMRPNAHAEAARWLRMAADAGNPAAFDRLADVYLQGIGLPFSLSDALGLYRHLAESGHAEAAWQAGYLAGFDDHADGDNDPSATAFLRACACAYPPAYYSLGLRFALGAGIARDAALARALLLRAADGGFLDARDAADALAPEHEAGDAAMQWHAALKRNLDAAQPMLAQLSAHVGQLRTGDDRVARLEAHLVSVGHPMLRLDARGRACVLSDGSAPLRAPLQSWRWLSQRPRVATCPGFATREECAHLMNKVAGSLAAPQQYRTGRSANDDAELAHFSGSGRPVGAMHSDAVVRMLERRLAEMSGWSMAALEPCSIVRYRPGEEYRLHVDYFSPEQIDVNRMQRHDVGGQRMATFLLYLRAAEAGGETEYPDAGLRVDGEPGMAVLHYNAHDDGAPDTASRHVGRPVQAGEKWLWRSALRQHSIYA